MRQIECFGDDRQNTWCLHCKGYVKGSRDHTPSKVFLDKPYPSNLPVVDVCTKCNQGFSLDEEYVACFIECVVCGSTDPDQLERPKIAEAIRRSPKLQSGIRNACLPPPTSRTSAPIKWEPETARLEKIVLKLARGHAFYKLHEPKLEEPKYLRYTPLGNLSQNQREAFETPPPQHLFPEIGSRAFLRQMSNREFENEWISVQLGRYRYLAIATEAIIVRFVIRDYLAVEVIWDF